MKTLRNEAEKRSIIAKLLLLIYYEWGKEITEELINFWLENLRGKHIPSCQQAAQLLVQSKPFGEPKIGDFMEIYRERTRGSLEEFEAERVLERGLENKPVTRRTVARKAITHDNDVIELPTAAYEHERAPDDDPYW